MTVAENGSVTYTFVINNTGSAAATETDAVTVTDTFDPILSGLTVSYDGTSRAVGTDYTYDQSTGAFSTSPGVITVPAATFTQDPATGAWTSEPGSVVITVTGTV